MRLDRDTVTYFKSIADESGIHRGPLLQDLPARSKPGGWIIVMSRGLVSGGPRTLQLATVR